MKVNRRGFKPLDIKVISTLLAPRLQQRLKQLMHYKIFSTAEITTQFEALAKLNRGEQISQRNKAELAAFLIISASARLDNPLRSNDSIHKYLEQLISNKEAYEEIDDLMLKWMGGGPSYLENMYIGEMWDSPFTELNLKDLELNPEVKSLLDVGCGAGMDAIFLAKNYPNLKVMAIDANPWNIKFMLDNLGSARLPNLEIHWTEAKKFLSTLSPESLDRILFKDFYTSDHFSDYFKLCHRLLKKGGMICSQGVEPGFPTIIKSTLSQ